MRYEIIGRGIANKYFVVDPDYGVLRIRDDLRKETDTEYQVLCDKTHKTVLILALSKILKNFISYYCNV